MSTGTKQSPGGNLPPLPKPKFRTPLNIMASAMVLAPAAGYVWYTNKHEQIEEKLQKSTQYASQMRTSESRKEDIVNIIRSVPDGNKQRDDKLTEVLHAGKVNATIKRKSHIDMDTAAYGDDEAIKKSRELQNSLKEERETRLAASKNRKKGVEVKSSADDIAGGSWFSEMNLIKGATVTTVGIAVVAAAGALIGGIGGSSRNK